MATITQDIRPYDVEIARNLCPDPSCFTTAWTNHLNVTTSISTDWASYGSTSMKTVTTTTGGGAARTPNTARAAISAGQTALAALDVRNGSGSSKSINVVLRFYNSAPGATLGAQVGADVAAGFAAVAAGAVRQVALTGVAPSGALSFAVIVSIAAGAIGDIFYIDRVHYEVDRVPAYSQAVTGDGGWLSGSIPNTVTDQYAWSGASNASDTVQLQRSPVSAPLTPTLELAESFAMRAPARSALHELLYPGTAVATLAAAGPRRGTLVLMFEDQAEAVRGFQMHLQPSTFTLDDLLMFGELNYIPQDDVRLYLDPRTRTKMVLEVPFVEVPA